MAGIVMRVSSGIRRLGGNEELGPLGFEITADKIRDQASLLLGLGLVHTEKYKGVSSQKFLLAVSEVYLLH
jgi:hypothetical protein